MLQGRRAQWSAIAQKKKRPIVRRTTRRGAPEPVERSATREEAPVSGALVTRNRGCSRYPSEIAASVNGSVVKIVRERRKGGEGGKAGS